MLLVRLTVLFLSLCLSLYGIYAALAAEFVLPTFSGVQNARLVYIVGLDALFSGLALASIAQFLCFNLLSGLSRHPVREESFASKSKIFLVLSGLFFVLAFTSALSQWTDVYGGVGNLPTISGEHNSSATPLSPSALQ